MDGIDAVAFDLYGTLLEIASVGRAAAEVTEEPAALVDLWRQKQLEQAGLAAAAIPVYELALKAFSLPAERILFVSSNAWDASGARSFGLPVAWVNRAGAPLERLGVPPNLVVANLAELAGHLG